MNIMLGVLFALANFLTYCDAQCVNTPTEIVSDADEQGCRDDDGIIHEFGSQWFAGCDNCMCDEKMGQTCCSTMLMPLIYDTATCDKVFQEETCTYKVVEKANPSKACKIIRFMG